MSPNASKQCRAIPAFERAAVCVAVTLVLVFCGGIVAAQPPRPTGAARGDERSEQEKETARALYKLGNERYADGDYRGALEAFVGAHRIMSVPTTGLGVGKARAKVGELVAARAILSEVTSHPVEDGEPGSFGQARTEARDLADDLGRRIPKLEVRVAGGKEPLEDLSVSIDGVLVPPESLARAHELDPGTHVVQISALGHAPSAQSIDLAEREVRVLNVALAQLAPATTQVLPTPHDAPRPPPLGRREAAPAAPPPSGTAAALPLSVVGFTLAGVGVVAGTVAGAISLTAAGELEDRCNPDKTCPPSAEADRDRSLTAAHVSTASFVLAGVGAVLGITGVVLEASASADTPPRVSLALGPGFVRIEGAL